MNNQVFTKTHYETIARLIEYRIPDFFTQENPDYNKSAESFIHTTSVDEINKIMHDIRKSTKEKKQVLLSTKETELDFHYFLQNLYQQDANKLNWAVNVLQKDMTKMQKKAEELKEKAAKEEQKPEPPKTPEKQNKFGAIFSTVLTKLKLKKKQEPAPEQKEEIKNLSSELIHKPSKEVHDVAYITRDAAAKHRKKEELANAEKATSDVMSSFGENIAVCLRTMRQYNKAGKKLFRIEKALTEELHFTDCSKVDVSFLRLPYPTICLHIPFNTKLSIQFDVVKWIYVTEREEDSKKLIEILCIMENGRMFSYTFNFTSGDIEEQVKQQITNSYGFSKVAVEENTNIVSFIMSTLLYINSTGADKTMIRPMVVDRKKHSNVPICILGRNIVINKDIERIYSEQGGTNTIHVLKWTVRGHFRNQKVGEGRKETKSIWIRPYLKGKDRNNDKTPVKQSQYKIVGNNL